MKGPSFEAVGGGGGAIPGGGGRYRGWVLVGPPMLDSQWVVLCSSPVDFYLTSYIMYAMTGAAR